MTSRAEIVAIVLVLAGFLLATGTDTGFLGALLVAGGTYALLLPRLVNSGGRSSAR